MIIYIIFFHKINSINYILIFNYLVINQNKNDFIIYIKNNNEILTFNNIL
jgi:hypothetical protein